MPITVSETTSRQLDTPAEITAYIKARLAAATASGLKAGDAVKIAAYEGRPPGLGAGDIGVVVGPGNGAAHVMVACLHDGGALLTIELPAGALTPAG